jgi:hypothetical protein
VEVKEGLIMTLFKLNTLSAKILIKLLLLVFFLSLSDEIAKLLLYVFFH